MTEPESTIDHAERAPTAATQRLSGVHQKMGAADVALGEAHQHLATLHQTGERPEERADDVHVAELKALRNCLEDACEALDDALARAAEVDIETPAEKADTSSEPDEREEPRRDPVDNLQWNRAVPTPPISIPRHPTTERENNTHSDP